MEQALAVGIGGGVLVLGIVSSLLWRAGRADREALRKLGERVETVRAELHQASFLKLDVSGIEKKVDEELGAMDGFIRQEFGSVSQAIKDIDESLERLEEAKDDHAETVEELVERITVLEEQIATLLPKDLSEGDGEG